MPVNLPFAVHRHFADRQMQRKRRPVLAQARDLAPDADDLLHAGREIAREVGVVLFVIGRRHQHVDVPADNLPLAVSEQPFSRRD